MIVVDLPVTDQVQQIEEHRQHSPHLDYAGFARPVYGEDPVRNVSIDRDGNFQGGVIHCYLVRVDLASEP